MTVEMLSDVVRDHPLFRALETDQAETLAGCAQNVGFAAGATIFRSGERADTFFLLRHGRVALDLHEGTRSLTIETLGPDDLLGWSWLIPPYRWQFDARAIDPVRAVAFDGACLRRKLERDHELGYALHVRFSRVLLERLQSTRLRLLDVYGHDGR